jgi:hypothetical protein
MRRSSMHTLAPFMTTPSHTHQTQPPNQTQVAGLPPVTKEWFEARKAQLTSAAAAPTSAKVWIDPLTKRRFQTQQTYQVGWLVVVVVCVAGVCACESPAGAAQAAWSSV